jgi:hypothetical protein
LKTTYSDVYRGYSVNADFSKGWGLYTEILDGIIDQIKNLQNTYSRIHVLRFDIRIPSKKEYCIEAENAQVSALIKAIKSNLALKRWGEHKKVAHGWVREVGKSGHGHYHVFIAYKSFQRSLGIISDDFYSGTWGLIKSCSERITGASVHFSGKAHLINRTDYIRLNDCIYHLSYLAKISSKDFGTGQKHKRYSFSRIKKMDSIAMQVSW